MSSLSLETPSRVQCIKQKFEISGKNAIVSSKSAHSSSIIQNSSSGSILLPQKSVTDFSKTEINKIDGKVQVKRTPAFRREKVGSVKTLEKFCSSRSEEKIKNIPNENINLIADKEFKFDLKNTKVQPLKDNNEFQNIQRSKTDLLSKPCDNKNCTKSTLVLRRVNLLGENQNTHSDDKLAYAVVDKSQKKNSSEKIQKNTELKLSESLRKALQSPLPKGPPPKKPPRTFCHVAPSAKSSINKSNSKEDTCKDLPKLKSKLEKLESIIKSHERKANTSSKLNENLKPDSESKTKKVIPEAIECKSLQNASKIKNVNKNPLQLTHCMKSCADVFDERLLKEEFLTSDVTKSESTHSVINTNKEKNISSSSSENFLTIEVAARRSTSEPIYDLPCVSTKSRLDNKLIRSKENSQSSLNKSQEGLHYLCTDVVNKLNRIKPLEFSPTRDGWPQTLSTRVTKVCQTSKENTHSAVPEAKKSTVTFMKNEKPQDKQDAETEEKENKEDLVLEKDLLPNNGKEIQSDSDSWSVGSESEREWTPESDLWFRGQNETNKSFLKKEFLTRKSARRKDYVNKVSSKLFNCAPYWMNLKGNNSSHLFECCLLVGLTLESERNVPYIKNIYPPSVKPPPLIEALCFPDASNWPPNTGNEPEEQYYSLVVTNENGERKFGYCRRVMPEGGNLCLPLTYCIITPHRANGFFYKVLEELESRHGSLGMENFIKQLYEAEFPGPGEVLKLKKILEEATKTSFTPRDSCITSTLVRRPCDVRLEEKNLTQLFQYLKLSVFIKIFSSLLHERKVLLLSISLRKLSSCIEALQSTLLPFSWQHTYVPVLPVYLLETCEAPTPYVIGLLKTKSVEHSLENMIFENGIMVDLDESKILKCCGDEATILPHRLIKSLKTSLNLAVNAIMLPETNRNVLISDAFIGFFVQVCGHYSKFISVSDGEKTFEKRGFVKHVTSATVQAFLEWFIKTAMFQAFIHERLHGIVDDIPVKLFTLRAMENPTEAMKNSTVLPLNYKVLNKKVKSFSDKIKDFIQ